MTTPRIRILFAIISAIIGFSIHLDAARGDKVGARILALVSHDTAPYKEALAGFQQYLSGQNVEAVFDSHFLDGDSSKADQILQKTELKAYSLVAAFGEVATRSAIRKSSKTPIIATMILDTVDFERAPNTTGVVLEFPVETNLEWLKRFFPDNEKVGVIYNPEFNKDKISAALRAAQKLRLHLVAKEVEKPSDIPAALEFLSRRVNVLWGIPDPTVLNPQTAKEVLLFSFRNRIPLSGLSLSWVKAGALYALERDYADLGAQCGEMAVKILEGVPPADIPPKPPRKLIYALNLKTAQHMNLSLSESIIRGAADVTR